MLTADNIGCIDTLVLIALNAVEVGVGTAFRDQIDKLVIDIFILKAGTLGLKQLAQFLLGCLTGATS